MPYHLSVSKQDKQHRLPVRGNALVVHEDAADLFYYRTVLQRAGCAVVTCNSYHQALGCMDAEHFDLIVLSQGSSAFEGRAVLEKAISTDRGRQVLVVARALNMGCYLEAMQLGARDYMEEPVLEAEMARAVETCLGPARWRPESRPAVSLRAMSNPSQLSSSRPHSTTRRVD